MKARRLISVSIDLVLVFLFVYLVIFPKNVSLDTKNALIFCAETLIPSLFVYTVLSKAVFSMPIAEKIEKIVGLPAFSLVMGTLCGAPLGAKNAMLLYENQKIDKKYAEYLCSFTNHASVSFVVGYVGSVLFRDTRVGARLLVYQLAASVITAVVMRFFIYGKAKPRAISGYTCKSESLDRIILDGAHTVINISACAVFFKVVATAVARLLSLDKIQNALLLSLLEFSSGVSESARLGGFSLVFCAFAIGFGGLSVAMQVKSVCGGKLSMRYYFLGKSIECALMTALAFIFG